MTKERKKGHQKFLADENLRIFREKVKLGKFSTESENCFISIIELQYYLFLFLTFVGSIFPICCKPRACDAEAIIGPWEETLDGRQCFRLSKKRSIGL